MKLENLKYIKRNLKNKVRITSGVILGLLLTGFISYSEEVKADNRTGIEIGENSYARGEIAITTSKNGIAIGKDSIATGGDETKESITNKLKENEEKLNEIKKQEKLVETKTEELNTKKLRERKVIEAAIRVEELEKAKEKAKLKWQEDLKAYNDLKEGSQAFLNEYKNKIKDLNSRLEGLSRINGVNIETPEGLEKTAKELKKIVEKDTTLNLSLDFYKDYTTNYYKALGDLRKNQEIYYNATEVRTVFNGTNTTSSYMLSIQGEKVVNGFSFLSNLLYLNHGIQFRDNSIYGDGLENSNIRKDIFENNNTITNKPTIDLEYINHLTTVLSKEKYEKYKEEIPKYIKSFKEYFNNTSDPFLTIENKKILGDLMEQKMKYWSKKYEIAYYQGEYERTKNISWLDKKKIALNELENLRHFDNFESINNREKTINNWKKINITDIEEKNKVNINTLTSELEQALGINKNAILEREKEIEKLNKTATTSETNYRGINPSEEDLVLSREYKRVKEEIDNLTKEVITGEERLKLLKESLSLNNLKNLGENNIAIGTKALAVKDDSIAIGTNTVTVGEQSITIGKDNITVGNSSLTLGNNQLNKGDKNVLLGTDNNVYGNSNFVLGNSNVLGKEEAPVNNNLVFGSNINIQNVSNSIVLGNGSEAVENAVSVGKLGAERKIVNVADGKISETSKEAINGSQLFTLENKIKNIKTSISKEELDTKLNKDGTGLSENERATLLQNLGLDNIATNINLENKANKDGSNIEIDKYIAKLNVGANIEIPTDKLVKDSDVKKYLDSNYTKSSDLDNKFNAKANKSDLDNKLNVDVSNLSDKGKENLIKKIGNGNLDKPIGEFVTDTIIKEKLDIKLNKDFSNLSYSDKESIRNNLDVYSKSETDNRILESEKKMVAGMANSIAHANVPQVSGNYLFALGAGTGYYNGESAIALGISGQTKDKRVLYKLNVGVDTKTKVSVGAGINVNLGIIEEPKQEIKEVPLAPIIYNNKEVKELARKNKELEERLNKLNDLLNEFKSRNKEVKTEKILLSNFDFDKYELKESHKNQLDSILEKEFSTIIITGYADEKGTVEYNQVLSEKRAKAVYDYLKEKGITQDIYYLGKGEINPLSSIDYSLNRRVEISIR